MQSLPSQGSSGTTAVLSPSSNVPPPKYQKPTAAQLQQQREFALRNESYYMATNETWSPSQACTVGNVLSDVAQQHINTSVLIEEDPEPPSP